MVTILAPWYDSLKLKHSQAAIGKVRTVPSTRTVCERRFGGISAFSVQKNIIASLTSIPQPSQTSEREHHIEISIIIDMIAAHTTSNPLHPSVEIVAIHPQ